MTSWSLVLSKSTVDDVVSMDTHSGFLEAGYNGSLSTLGGW